MVELEKCYSRNENFVYRRIEDETILVPIKDNVGDMGSIYSLNEIGAFIWEQLDGRKKLGAVKEKILQGYEVAPREAEKDLSEFVTDLIEIEAVKLVDCPG
jgi:hypothetical protein